MGEEHGQDQFTEIDLRVFLKLEGPIPFDLYVQLASGRFTKVFNRGDTADLLRLETYSAKGVEKLFILKVDRKSYIQATEQLVNKILSSDTVSQEQVTQAIGELSSQTVTGLVEQEFMEAHALDKAQELAGKFIDFSQMKTENLMALLTQCKGSTYVVRHSMATAVIGLYIARLNDVSSDDALATICLGGFFHDMGLHKLPTEITQCARHMSLAQQKLLHSHVSIGVEQGRLTQLADPVLKAIEQHHEYFDGSGYPNRLKGQEICFAARVIAIADCFSSLVVPYKEKPLATIPQAVNVMLHNRERFDPAILTPFIQSIKAQELEVAV